MHGGTGTKFHVAWATLYKKYKWYDDLSLNLRVTFSYGARWF